MSLNPLQARLCSVASRMVLYAEAKGLHLAYGRAFETPEQNALVGGIPNSLHCMRLAIDFVLFDADWNYLTKTEDYKILGDWWKSQGPEFCWGGDFVVKGKPKPDGNHFSIAYGGMK